MRWVHMQWGIERDGDKANCTVLIKNIDLKRNLQFLPPQLLPCLLILGLKSYRLIVL